MKLSILSLSLVFLISCGNPYQQPVMVQPRPVVVQQQPMVQQSVPNYEVRTDAFGNQVVYYTDPYSGTSLFLDMVLWNSLIGQPGGYSNVHQYYIGHRSYFTNSYSRYHTTYTRSYYRSSSDGGARYRSRIPPPTSSSGYRSSMPTGGSQSQSTYRSSMPTGRPVTTTSSPSPTYRSSLPSGRASSSSSSSGRSSMPSGRRH